MSVPLSFLHNVPIINHDEVVHTLELMADTNTATKGWSQQKTLISMMSTLPAVIETWSAAASENDRNSHQPSFFDAKAVTQRSNGWVYESICYFLSSPHRCVPFSGHFVSLRERLLKPSLPFLG